MNNSGKNNTRLSLEKKKEIVDKIQKGKTIKDVVQDYDVLGQLVKPFQ